MTHEAEPGTFEYDEALRAKRRKVIYLNVGAIGFMVAILWVLFFVKLIWGIDLLSRARGRDAISIQASFYITLGATAAAFVWAIWRIRGGLALVEHGVEVVGRITSVSLLRSHGHRPVRFEYEYEGVRYEGAADLSSDAAAGLQAGSPIVLLVNAKKPRHASPKSKVGI